ncbi:SDR family NAD(P)-dependent oxidoreductase [Alloalcanivorax xenomutans]|uniref:SDR family NAD(P)-dependent oxidoreductase n=1 Tax=Alloalcanivorax xenomutans TaxID=1094342 RepID=UPI003BACEA21
MRVKDKVALVTGAGSIGPGLGNGKAISLLLAREGARVLAVDRNLDAALETQRLVHEQGGVCEVFQADVSINADVKAMVEACVDHFGRCDILVNNVGISEIGGPVELPEKDWDRVFAVNVKSMFLACKHVLPLMEKQGGGAIVNMSSLASTRWGGVPYVCYGASKAAVNGLSRYVALEYAAKGIRVNTVLPGLINTPMIVEPLTKFYGGDQSRMIALRDAKCPTGKMGEAWDVAHAVLYLASDEAKYINGIELVVDGGLSQQ